MYIVLFPDKLKILITCLIGYFQFPLISPLTFAWKTKLPACVLWLPIENIKSPEITKEDEKVKENKEAQEKAEEEAEVISQTPTIKNIDEEQVVTKLTFNDFDSAISTNNREEIIDAPKTLERLEDISVSRSLERRMMEDSEDDSDDERIQIHTGTMDLTEFDLLDEPKNNDTGSADIILEAEELL